MTTRPWYAELSPQGDLKLPYTLARKTRERFWRGLRLNLNLNSCGKLDAHKSLNSLRLRVKDIDQSLVRAHLKLLTAVLVLVNRSEDSDNLSVGRKRNRTADLASISLSNFYNLLCCGVNDGCIVALESNSDFSLCDSFLSSLLVLLNTALRRATRFHTLPGVSNTPL